MDFRTWAVLSALFAGLTALASKRGLEGVPANLAIAVRVSFILVLVWGIAAFSQQTDVRKLTPENWGWLGFSAVATGGSWYCYFRALQKGPISVVAPIDKLSFVLAIVLAAIFLREKITPNVGIGCVLIVAGVLITLKT
jgi:transporter family protein